MKATIFLAFLVLGFASQTKAQTVQELGTGPTTPATISSDYNSNCGGEEMCTAESYVTAWIGQDSSGNWWIYTDAVLEGQVGPIGVEKYAQHTYNENTTLNGVYKAAQAGPTENYVEVTNDNDVEVGDDWGGIFDFSGDQSITCSIIGNFFNYTTSTTQFELAYTRDISLGTQQNCTTNNAGITICDISVQAWCDADTSPPDYNPAYVTDETYCTRPHD